MNDKGRLQDKVAVVTGAAHGIGRAIAELFAEEGARVWIADLDRAAGEQAAAGIRERGGQALFMACDVSSVAEVKRVVASMATEANRIDIVCNNAAYMGKQWHACAEASDEEWEKSFRVSLLGAQYVTREALPLMTAKKNGSIINISSMQGLVGAKSSAAYTAIKHGLIGFTRSVAYDYGVHNIRCNAICPGAIQTRISPEPGSELHQRQVSKTFLGRTGRPREVAYAALFLGSDESCYVTGAVLAVDGGWTAM